MKFFSMSWISSSAISWLVAATFKVMKMCSEIAVPGLVPFGV